MEGPEMWFPVNGHYGKYEISKNGKVRSLDRVTVTYNEYTKRTRTYRFKGKDLTGQVTCHGYRQVTLYGKDDILTISVHRLVAIQFIPNPFNLPCVNHKDGNKLNNALSNLEWVTHSENQIHKWRVLYPAQNRYNW